MAGRSPDIGTGSFHEKARREDFLKWFTIFLRSAVAGGARRSRIGQASIRTRGGGVNGPRWCKGQKGSWFDNGQSPFENRGFVGIAPLKSPHELADAGGRAHREAIRQPTIRDAGYGL